MKPSDIQEGKTYLSKESEKTVRRVVAIGDEHRPTFWFFGTKPPAEPGVLYVDETGQNERRMYLSEFSEWAGSEVIETD